MGDDIGSVSVTDCLLRSFSDLERHTQQCRASLWQKSKQTEPETMSSPINNQAYIPYVYLIIFLNALLFLKHLPLSKRRAKVMRTVRTFFHFQQISKFLLYFLFGFLKSLSYFQTCLVFLSNLNYLKSFIQTLLEHYALKSPISLLLRM